jgi:F5/8 type C domain
MAFQKGNPFLSRSRSQPTISVRFASTPEISQNDSTNEQKNLGLGLATLALSIANASTAQAALITGVTATTDMGNLNPSFYNIDYIVNGSGLSSLSLTATHSSSAGSRNAWVSNNGTTAGNITFNLNGVYSLAGFSLWNFSFFNNFGVKGVNVLTSTDGITFTNVAGAPTQFAIGAANVPESPEQFSFAPVTASYVRFNVLSSQGSPAAGLNEVQFNSADSATSVPEPFTILGTLTAVGGGAALKRRLKGIESKSE